MWLQYTIDGAVIQSATAGFWLAAYKYTNNCIMRCVKNVFLQRKIRCKNLKVHGDTRPRVLIHTSIIVNAFWNA